MNKAVKDLYLKCGRILLLPVLFVVLCCSNDKPDSESKIQQLYKNAPMLNETASFLAGMDISPDSTLYTITLTKQYSAYKNQMDITWKQFQETKLQRIEAWRDLHNLKKGYKNIFYPFSGPDIANALAFFPELTEVIMIGLEPPGDIQDPHTFAQDRVINGLWGISNALRTLLQLNLFRTSEMMVDIRDNSFTDIAQIMMFFLKRYGYEILDARKITVSKEGDIIPLPEGNAGAGMIRAVEIVFRKGKGAPIQTARYFKVDLSDGPLKATPQFIAHVKKQGEYATFIKSASYLLHYENFTTVRNIILEQSQYVVQDDSGIPIRYYSDKDWKLEFHGTYTLLEMFAHRFQADLSKMLKEKSSGPLPFSFGYGFSPARSSIIIAERRILPLEKKQQ